MTLFFNLTEFDCKGGALKNEIQSIWSDGRSDTSYSCDVSDFALIPGCPFLYFVPDVLLKLVEHGDTLAGNGFRVRKGNGVAVRFHRLHWEVSHSAARSGEWPFFVHGTPFSPFYKPSYFRMNWLRNGAEAKADVLERYPYLNGNFGLVIQGEDFYGKPGLCYGKRTENFSAQVLPRDHQFTFEGNAIERKTPDLDYWAMLAILNASPVDFWLSAVCAQHKYPNYVDSVPVPKEKMDWLGKLARQGWALMRTLDTVNEISPAFVLPERLRFMQGPFDRKSISREVRSICKEIDEIVCEAYGLFYEERDRVRRSWNETDEQDENGSGGDGVHVGEHSREQCREDASLISWAVGVAFGRFDWRLATGERTALPEPDPFDPLPVNSPGMLPNEAVPFHKHPGMLVDDPGHEHDLPRLVEAVLEQVDAPVDRDIRRWLRRDFFKYHLQQYSKSRRKAPIYWPLATASSNYTVWVYYPMLAGQTLFTAVNDFVEPKLQQVAEDIAGLRQAGANRSRQDERQLEALVDFEAELAELRDTLLAIAPDYKPDQDDGVQITTAPLWPVFRHTPWRNVLKETWERLERGDYDWAKLAMAYWPQRVREKCVTDQSLAIAHDLEHLYEPPAEADGKRSKKN